MAVATDTVLSGANALYLEEMLRQFREDPAAVDASWRAYFEGEGRDLAGGPTPDQGPRFRPNGVFAAGGHGSSNGALRASSGDVDPDLLHAQVRIAQLIDAYRSLGHMKASLDPLGLASPRTPKDLDYRHWGFTEADLDRRFSTASLYGARSMTLRELLDFLDDTYARTIGVEFMHINDARVQHWIQDRCERSRNHLELDRSTQLFILRQLCRAESFEEFLHVKYRGTKRFSLEGAEALIPLLALLIEESGRRGVREAVFGMPHRGRLNVMVNIFGKRHRDVFAEFDDKDPQSYIGRGDVKYHLGYSTDQDTRHGDRLHLSLTCNPSHLEAVNPVLAGRVRAKQDRTGDTERVGALPVLIHGDAAFPGQGLVSESLNLARLNGYDIGGTVHIIVNNQIGFTTMPDESRSSVYCTDISKMVEVPIFHVNGEDPEAVAQVARLACEFRQEFRRDVIIDMYCFRRYGHNEADEPAFTQPLMYREIKRHTKVYDVYAQKLGMRGAVSAEDTDRIREEENAILEGELNELRESGDTKKVANDPGFGGVWGGYLGGFDLDVEDTDTAVDRSLLEQAVERFTAYPEGFEVNRKVARLLDRRRSVLTEGATMDWGVGESLAFATLVMQGHPVRMTGQDARRGTFSHRHALLTDPRDGRTHMPLQHLTPDQARFECHNSPLSEAAVLGFEYGYSLDAPDALVIWEAQFGDFANGAQVIIDQFISASEDKWNRCSGVVMLLPHGYEGQGPEHSSARLERFLQLCAEDNMQVANVTTPAQIFHVLRRQVIRKWRKPLVIMSPKSLLRHQRAVSTLDDLEKGRFQRVIGEELLEDPGAVKRAVLCSGKVYFDLLDHRDEIGDTETALLRVELLYPFPKRALAEALAPLGGLEEIVWCQEEPRNMGSLHYLYPIFEELFADGPPVRWVTREASASPATGSKAAHNIEQLALMNGVFGTRDPGKG